VRIVAVRGNQVDFRGVNLLDSTPVLDVKPFEPHLDVPGYRPGDGWLDHVHGGWYDHTNATANPHVSPGEHGLRGAGFDPSE
jgi:tRNA (Thr-GGU) A37 N-methylase